MRSTRILPIAIAIALAGTGSALAARVLSVRDEGHLRFLTSSGSELIDEGAALGTLPGRVRVRFLYDGDPTVGAQFTIYGREGSISGRAEAKLSNPNSPDPSFRGAFSIIGGSGRYAHVHGAGELFGVFYRRGSNKYGLVVQTIGKLPY
ncbi:MAG TPA: hypothetical protein VK730_00700 [Solirubrobacteraceae bacterium]|nr:hypothetical protein [Solirubrobacteraceae bacterium]